MRKHCFKKIKLLLKRSDCGSGRAEGGNPHGGGEGIPTPPADLELEIPETVSISTDKIKV